MGLAGSWRGGSSPAFHYQPAFGLWTQQVRSVEIPAARVPFQFDVHLEVGLADKLLDLLQNHVLMIRWSGSCSKNSC